MRDAPHREADPTDNTVSLVILTYLLLFLLMVVYVAASSRWPLVTRSILFVLTFINPLGMALEYQAYIFCCMWLAFTLCAAGVVLLARQDSANACRVVFGFFAVVHRLSLLVALTGFLSLFVFVIAVLFDRVWLHVCQWGFILCGIGAFFGVAQRDCAVLCGDFIHVRSARKFRHQANMCVVCGQALRDLETRADAAGRIWHAGSCQHEWHEECARGWVMVGKKGISPCCGDKLPDSIQKQQNPWDHGVTYHFWSDLLDLTKWAVVYFPLFLFLKKHVYNLA